MQRRQFLSLAGLMTPLAGLKAQTSHVGVVMDDDFEAHKISPQHPERPERYAAVKRAIMDTRWMQPLTILSPIETTLVEPWLETVHPVEHIQGIKQDLSKYHSALLATAGVLAAVDAVMSGEVQQAFSASRPPGHHATDFGREEGFCYFNHVAIAARYLQKHHQLERILIIDWDYHHGNGSEWAFYDDPSVLVFSTHDQFAYPGTGSPSKRGEGKGEGYNINVHLDCGSGDEAIMQAFKRHLQPRMAEFKPDFILISAGFDSRQDDVLGCFNISDQGFYNLTRWVVEHANRLCDGRVVSLLEGGYNIEGNAQAVVAHLQGLQASQINDI
jgi:acetoin utilization deacetylase AcuC-like enzyme